MARTFLLSSLSEVVDCSVPELDFMSMRQGEGGDGWLHACDVTNLGGHETTYVFHELVYKARNRLQGLIAGQFVKLHGSAEGWTVVALKGEWMRETDEIVDGKRRLTVDCTYRFEKV